MTGGGSRERGREEEEKMSGEINNRMKKEIKNYNQANTAQHSNIKQQRSANGIEFVSRSAIKKVVFGLYWKNMKYLSFLARSQQCCSCFNLKHDILFKSLSLSSESKCNYC
jgi:hypothetical protein